jgi:hypothetical protein
MSRAGGSAGRAVPRGARRRGTGANGGADRNSDARFPGSLEIEIRSGVGVGGRMLVRASASVSACPPRNLREPGNRQAGTGFLRGTAFIRPGNRANGVRAQPEPRGLLTLSVGRLYVSGPLAGSLAPGAGSDGSRPGRGGQPRSGRGTAAFPRPGGPGGEPPRGPKPIPNRSDRQPRGQAGSGHVGAPRATDPDRDPGAGEIHLNWLEPIHRPITVAGMGERRVHP